MRLALEHQASGFLGCDPAARADRVLEGRGRGGQSVKRHVLAAVIRKITEAKPATPDQLHYVRGQRLPHLNSVLLGSASARSQGRRRVARAGIHIGHPIHPFERHPYGMHGFYYGSAACPLPGALGWALPVYLCGQAVLWALNAFTAQ